MNTYFQTKDRCRQGLIKYLEQACKKVRIGENARILDIGCGTGVPTLWLAEHFPGSITAIDLNDHAIGFLKRKIIGEELQNRVNVIQTSFFTFEFNPDGYDLILAEGFLNVIGFEKGFNIMKKLLRNEGYLIIHDEFKNHEWKCEFMKAGGFEMIETILLDDKVWWNDYYQTLEEEIGKIALAEEREFFSSDLEEIRMFRTDPSPFQSIYYVIRK